MRINSKEYWNERFDTDWLDYAGDKQTVFFANLLCDMLPEVFVREVMTRNYTICDMGCALGEGIPIFSRKFSTNVDGMDFSSEAIEKAKEQYPQNHFWIGDLQNLDSLKKYDVVICSNVLEHFYNPWEIFKNLAQVAQKYIVIMVPYKETLEIEEHEYHFSENVIPVNWAGFVLDYVRTADGRDIKETYYPDQQILLIYKKESKDTPMLSDLTAGIEAAIRRTFEREIEKKESIIQEKEQIILEKQASIEEKEDIIQNKDRTICEKQEIIDSISVNEKELEGKCQIHSSVILKREEEILGLKQYVANMEKALLDAKSVCYEINSKTSYKILCTGMRFWRQFIMGSFEDKKKFLLICKRSITRERSEFTGNDGYNMILNVANYLNIPRFVGSKINENLGADNKIDDNKKITLISNSYVEQVYQKTDIIIFSVINYDFRYQRPQHFASRFAENGHRVFYVNANFVNRENVNTDIKNLFIVDFFTERCKAIYYASEWNGYEEWFKGKIDKLIYEYAIRDAVIILDYPNWIYGAEYMRKTYGFKIIVDYMDDFTGFLGTITKTLRENCIHMLESSDLVVTSSQFLSDIAIKYAPKSIIVRNGTEVEHFYQAVNLKEHKKRPVIGYYGAVSHWFDWEKVCYVAENMTDCDVVIIGEVTDYKNKLVKHQNIKLLGEKSYQELPKHLAYFDVCLIPFETTTDLIKATNPVKFYEYLSAGKRIVATEIPELEPYRDEFVYMSNDNKKFLEYVKMCLDGTDTLRKPEDCIMFARENDWQRRYENFVQACFASVPKVSIIVLTYNNLELNKACINSILLKTAYPNYELIILDNHSTDGTVEYLHELEKTSDSRVKIIFNEKNSGFAGGNNKAIQVSTGDFIMLLNNDTVVTRGWLTNAVKHMQNDAKCGMCGAVTNSIGNEAMIAVNYRNTKELEQFAYIYTSEHNNEIYTQVDRLAMFCTLIRREILDNFGMLDENYQVGMFEDDDYAEVVKQAGYKFYIVEDVFVHHVNNASFKKIETKEYKEIFERNKRYFEKKWNVKWSMPHYRQGVTADINEGMMIEPKD